MTGSNRARAPSLWTYAHNPYMHRSVCDLEMVGWLVPVARYAGLAEWLPAWNRNGDVHRDTEPYLHWNALCESHWVSRSTDQSNIQQIRAYIWFKRRDRVQNLGSGLPLDRHIALHRVWSRPYAVSATPCTPLLHHSDVRFFLVARLRGEPPRETYGTVDTTANSVSIMVLWRACDYF